LNSSTHKQNTNLHKTLVFLAGSTLFLAMIQVTLGAIVRVTDSGLACPDWPLCYGKLIPEFDFNILMEYTHRLSASLLMLTIFSTTFISYKILKHNKIAIFATTGASITVICAAIFGGITVISKLDWWSVPSHLALAEILILFLSILNTAIWFGDFNNHSIWKNLHIKHRVMLSTTLLSIFILIVYGAIMVAKGYGSSCGTWPLCNGELIPTRLPMIINASHRFLTLVVLDMYYESINGKNILGYGAGEGLHRIFSFFKDEPIVGGYVNSLYLLSIGFLFEFFDDKKNKMKYIIFLISFFF